MLTEETLARAEERTIAAANTVIEQLGEQDGALMLRVVYAVVGRKIADCERMNQMRRAFAQRCAEEKVARKLQLVVSNSAEIIR